MGGKGGFQPYSKLIARPPTMALQNMTRGKTIGGANPSDPWRAPLPPGRPARSARAGRAPRNGR